MKMYKVFSIKHSCQSYNGIQPKFCSKLFRRIITSCGQQEAKVNLYTHTHCTCVYSTVRSNLGRTSLNGYNSKQK